MLRSYSNVIVTGSIAYDEIMDFPGRFIDYLQKDKLHQINVSFVVDKLEKQLGGTGTNIVYNIELALRFGGRIILLAAVGKDGKNFLDFFKKNKIDTGGILIDKKLYTAAGKVITDIGNNQIWGFYYGACEKAKEIDLKKFADAKNSLVVISANHPEAFLNFQRRAIELGVDFFYDCGKSLTWILDDDLKEGVNECYFLVGNDYEISMIMKRLRIKIEDLINKGISVITTLGEKGVLYQSKDENHMINSYKVRKIVDPTGAGDAWQGGFIAGMINGKSIVECLKQGNVLASFAIEKYGTVNHRPSIKEIDKRMKVLNESKF